MALVDGISYKLPKIKLPQRKKRPIWSRILTDLGSIAGLSLLVFLTINLPAYLIITKYAINPEAAALPSTPNIETRPVVYETDAIYPANTIVIPKIGVNAPIIWNVPEGQSVEKLQEGVIQIAGTGQPGENKNVFLSGHSSNYWWKKGGYNTVFALLPQLNSGDEIYLTSDKKTYRYKVTSRLEVDKNEAKQYLVSNVSQVTLMTCVPIGTNLKRFLVIAQPVSIE